MDGDCHEKIEGLGKAVENYADCAPVNQSTTQNQCQGENSCACRQNIESKGLVIRIHFQIGPTTGPNPTRESMVWTLSASKNTERLLAQFISLQLGHELRAAGCEYEGRCCSSTRERSISEQLPDASKTELGREVECNSIVLTFDEQLLLEALIRIRNGQRRDYGSTWKAKWEWFREAGLDRHRKDAQELIDRLLRCGFVERRILGERGGWQRYRATDAGEAYLMQTCRK